MGKEQHGLSISVESEGNLTYLAMKVYGKLTHEDYQQFTPELEATLKKLGSKDIHALADISELKGWEMHAAWDDFSIGMEHGSEFAKIALVGDKVWQEPAAEVASWFTSGQVESFHSRNAALNWLTE